MLSSSSKVSMLTIARDSTTSKTMQTVQSTLSLIFSQIFATLSSLASISPTWKHHTKVVLWLPMTGKWSLTVRVLVQLSLWASTLTIMTTKTRSRLLRYRQNRRSSRLSGIRKSKCTSLSERKRFPPTYSPTWRDTSITYTQTTSAKKKSPASRWGFFAANLSQSTLKRSKMTGFALQRPRFDSIRTCLALLTPSTS